MKKIFNKITTGLATFWMAIVSFFSKVFGEYSNFENEWWRQEALYATPYREQIEQQPTIIDTIIKITKRPLIGITLIIWIISLIKIKKTKDKTQKKKKIKRTIIIISILVVLIIACLLLPLLLKKY